MLDPLVGQESDLGLALGVGAREERVEDSNEACEVKSRRPSVKMKRLKGIREAGSPAVPLTLPCPLSASDQSNFGFGLGGFIFPKLLLLVV